MSRLPTWGDSQQLWPGNTEHFSDTRVCTDQNAASHGSTGRRVLDVHTDSATGRLSSGDSFTHCHALPPPMEIINLGNVECMSDWSKSPGQYAMKCIQRDTGNPNFHTSETIPFSSDSPRKGNSSVAPAITTILAPPETPRGQFDVCSGTGVDSGGLASYLAEEMPRGRFIVMNLLSTWGAPEEVGINGMEFFNENGERIIPPAECLKKSSSSLQLPPGSTDGKVPQEKSKIVDGHHTILYTTPQSSLSVMVAYPVEGSSSDSADASAGTDEVPRSDLANLVNGIHNTHDDTKLFTMPFNPDKHHLICFAFPKSVVISMVRVHNYGGRGRVHTSKGVRLLEMTVDDELVFRGEIAPNNGDVVPFHRVGLENCENILFTEEPRVLRRLLAGPATETFVQGRPWGKERRTTIGVLPREIIGHSTTISTVLFGTVNEDKSKRMGSERSVLIPAAVPVHAKGKHIIVHNSLGNFENATATLVTGIEHQTSGSLSMSSRYPQNVTSLCFLLLGTWGDTEKIGLSGLRFRDAQGDMVSQRIAHWYVRFPSQRHESDVGEKWEDQLVYLFDENAETAFTLPCEQGIEVIFIFDTPLPTLGFVEVANYSLGEHTFSGVKEARLFLSSATPNWSPDALVAAYSALWEINTATSCTTLNLHGIFEATPEEGVSLRKAPSFLSIPRFQVYDLSLAAELRAFEGGSGALRNSLTHSLSASMTIRAEMALRRARMALKPRPEWFLEYQSYLTPLLPVAYVLKVSFGICARSAMDLRKYAKKWMVNPLRACTFADENGETIQVCSRDGAKDTEGHGGDVAGGVSMSENTHAFVTECLFTPRPNALQEDEEAAVVAAQAGIRVSLFQASLSLVYVSDSPFCLSLLTLNRPLLQEEECAAWVRQIRVFMDDALVFDSGDVGIPRRAPLSTVGPSSPLRPAGEGFLPLAVGGGGAGNAVHRMRLKPLVFFTLDTAQLEEARREMMVAG
ncbi:hypothetical protein ECC02_007397 [Trypanosoma cruzi]|uniref:KATNIP domain-containing protein n=1 Tax=Trypanosoma cruzi TaxID=5693 RepID=A0A7J6XZ02_TRYCR|nr:hypothetical protein ECC02_007397 [Trypanosoma cruzi]